ncbi:DinB family protein [Marininema halotolerans]|uniref:DinB family protein n=1 Tax=Marininema halotolerans TaxID=1155944 RepID=A0A1I6NTC6_9BACL|nr:DinB family protein [Marininema halotolerans]SFS31125.1 DinB family protein [Marininema halotolerans]
MTGTSAMRELLLEELEGMIRSTKGLLKKVEPNMWQYRPHENMRSLQELATHLTQIPFVDLAILQEKTEEEIRQLEQKLTHEQATEMAHVMDEGFLQLRNYMVHLEEEEFLTKKTKPFYLEQGSTQAKWLTEILGHVVHHRAQLFNYLKEKGASVNMFDLY